ncbi:hypothetical protein RI054_24g103230 [Pseudoscourfieldia marina]
MAETYVKAFSLAFGAYAAQMLVVPNKMVTDHFNAPATPMLNFWIRGQAVSLGAMIFLLNKVDTDTALTVATASSAAIGILHPWNAKFGYLSPEIPKIVKYPMHYVPECLMAALTLGGLYLMATK